MQHEIGQASLQQDLKSLNQMKVMIPAEDFLGLKADLCSSWKRNRELKNWLKKYGIFTKCEAQLRKKQEQIIGDNLLGEWLPFQFEEEGGTIVKSTPCVTVKDLKQKIEQQLEGYDRLGMLTWHGIIPEDEVWVKIGGDKGGGTFKEMFQIANVACPNAPRHTVVICAFPASDSTPNLELGLARIKEQIHQLQVSTWREKKFRLFAFGDYEYLCRMYGLAGASGRHCCLFCNITKANMKVRPADLPKQPEPRSLQSLHNDYQDYTADGARPERMKKFFNVIHEPLLEIPLSQVCIPGLHISLGLFLKHFNSFEGACHDLDVLLANNTLQTNEETSKQFDTVSRALSRARQLESQAKELEDTAMLLREHLLCLDADDENVTIYSRMIQEHLQEKNTLVSALNPSEFQLKESQQVQQSAGSVPVHEGPVMKAVEDVLQKIKVHRQAYHGKSFVGNHVHRCCQKENIEKLTGAVTDVTQKLCPSLLPQAMAIKKKYGTLLRLFAACHKAYNKAAVMPEEEINALELTIEAYTSYFRKEFPNETVPPKMHLLESHAIPFIRKWKVGLGFHGEQGGESVHARLNTIHRDVRGLKDDLAVLQSVMKTHWLQTRPGAI
ncbi:hypothetical protein HOLleu_44000 [Holothuria leucospilota]|uniref:Uncharacterized protein n=1 Tax=Holothuria leucospilota TaxID=206669 RepID=A0A9Q0YDS4_HOLLE|nr:hypothetical protein HOLleu_44000 [Holothuria leucospilota]